MNHFDKLIADSKKQYGSIVSEPAVTITDNKEVSVEVMTIAEIRYEPNINNPSEKTNTEGKENIEMVFKSITLETIKSVINDVLISQFSKILEDITRVENFINGFLSSSIHPSVIFNTINSDEFKKTVFEKTNSYNFQIVIFNNSLSAPYELLEKFYDSEKEKIITENEFTINLTIHLFYKDDEGNLYNYKLN